MNCASPMRVIVIVALTVASADVLANVSQDAEAILAAAGVTGGFVVHLGAGTGELTAALQMSPAVQVHGLEADATKVEAARKSPALLPIPSRKRSGK